MNKHTAGPWKIGNEHNYQADRYAKNAEWSRVRDKNGGLIAKVESVNPKGKRQSCDFDIEAANARLIAAAPELLAACKAMLAGFTSYHRCETASANIDDVTRRAQTIAAARAAIAKASGGNQ